MGRQRYTEDQMTAWVIATRLPVIHGSYQLRSINSTEIVEAWYSDGRWQVGFDGVFSPLRLNPLKFEWRGLNFDPTTTSSWWTSAAVRRTWC